mmetsp:Transcript_64592/g.127713  ORF Transcript_64592/g.127713 Transcript_64592/m.127713 type:complete len:95 (-) Transcript_64592:241-525(-)
MPPKCYPTPATRNLPDLYCLVSGGADKELILQVYHLKNVTSMTLESSKAIFPPHVKEFERVVYACSGKTMARGEGKTFHSFLMGVYFPDNVSTA